MFNFDFFNKDFYKKQCDEGIFENISYDEMLFGKKSFLNLIQPLIHDNKIQLYCTLPCSELTTKYLSLNLYFSEQNYYLYYDPFLSDYDKVRYNITIDIDKIDMEHTMILWCIYNHVKREYQFALKTPISINDMTII